MTNSNQEPTPIGGAGPAEDFPPDYPPPPIPAGQPYIKFGIPDVDYSSGYIPLTLDDPDADREAMEAALETAVWFRAQFLEAFPLPEAPALPADPPAGQQRGPDDQQRPPAAPAAQPQGGGGGGQRRGQYPIVAYCRQHRVGVHFSAEKYQPLDADKCYHEIPREQQVVGPDGKKQTNHTMWWRETFRVENAEFVSNAGIPMPEGQQALANKKAAAAQQAEARRGGGAPAFTGGNPAYNDGGPDDLPFKHDLTNNHAV